MFGAFRATNALSSGLLWKIPWRLSRFQKARQRRRLRAVDAVVATVDQALAKKGETLKALDVWKETMPTEAEMLPKDKYTMFDRKEKRYRKGIHSRFLPFGEIGFTLDRGDADLAIPPLCRTTEMDESFTTCEPAGLLDD
ncbi:mitochondrial ribosomal protein L31-domain-containing protein [Xylaria sp. FL1777]|nr:mitochondrial ribosomal protein L31-domain-containing protein [Xylaria sp. FL1777]